MTYLLENGVYLQATPKTIKEIAQQWAQRLDVKVLMYRSLDERKWHPAYYRQGQQDYFAKDFSAPPFNYYS